MWAAAVPLARHLGGLAQDWASTSVCELGAGCGLCGLAAVALGAKRVVLTDLELKMCQRNADANFHGADRDRVCVRELHWGRGGNGGKRCCGGLCTHEGFDMIIGSDLIYTIGAAEAVAETMSMLSKPGTVALLCNPEVSEVSSLLLQHPATYSLHYIGGVGRCDGRLCTILSSKSPWKNSASAVRNWCSLKQSLVFEVAWSFTHAQWSVVASLQRYHAPRGAWHYYLASSSSPLWPWCCQSATAYECDAHNDER